MGYTLVYTQVLEFLPYLIKGAWISLQIAILAFFGGMLFGLILATIRTFGSLSLIHISEPTRPY